jgi:myo-inositol-1(or 4)-monophosphatase
MKHEHSDPASGHSCARSAPRPTPAARRRRYSRSRRCSRSSRAGSAALDLANVAAGRYDGYWEFNLNPWDTAAGVLLVEEAGGRVTDFHGGPFQLHSRETVASNGLIHDSLVHEFDQIFAGRDLEPLADPREYLKK